MNAVRGREPGSAEMHLIIAPPMTPNGDLHVGHMSGPYLAADVYRRYVEQLGKRAVYAVSSDDNQSYVDTTAERLKLDARTLVERSRAEVKETFRTYNLGADVFGSQDAAYADFVRTFFHRLHERGLLRVAEIDVLFEPWENRYPTEAFVSGVCPNCLEGTCGGICEGCGHPNGCIDLLELDRKRYEVRREPRLLFDCERFRPELRRYLDGCGPHRPAVRRLIDELLAKPLAPFVMSYKTPRGLHCDLPGLEGQRLNVWGEMYTGHLYFLQQAAGELRSSDHYVQFFGFDNSYFYVVLHAALGLAARQAGFDYPMPEAFVVNRFYNLEARKFSTSQGHLIWARELARSFNVDLIRLYLAQSGPEHQEANFDREGFAREASALVQRVNSYVELFNQKRSSSLQTSAFPEEISRVMGRECSVHDFEMSRLSRLALSCLDLMQRKVKHGEHGLLTYFPSVLVQALEPFCPEYTRKVRAPFEIPVGSWTSLPAAGMAHPLPRFESAP